jgi:hypothetical protein
VDEWSASDHHGVDASTGIIDEPSQADQTTKPVFIVGTHGEGIGSVIVMRIPKKYRTVVLVRLMLRLGAFMLGAQS